VQSVKGTVNLFTNQFVVLSSCSFHLYLPFSQESLVSQFPPPSYGELTLLDSDYPAQVCVELPISSGVLFFLLDEVVAAFGSCCCDPMCSAISFDLK